jgi:hypothetical protein
LGPAALVVGGALMAGAAAGAFIHREDLGAGYSWITDHMKYVRTLWDQDVLRKRMDDLMDIEARLGVVFKACVS